MFLKGRDHAKCWYSYRLLVGCVVRGSSPLRSIASVKFRGIREIFKQNWNTKDLYHKVHVLQGYNR